MLLCFKTDLKNTGAFESTGLENFSVLYANVLDGDMEVVFDENIVNELLITLNYAKQLFCQFRVKAF